MFSFPCFHTSIPDPIGTQELGAVQEAEHARFHGDGKEVPGPEPLRGDGAVGDAPAAGSPGERARPHRALVWPGGRGAEDTPTRGGETKEVRVLARGAGQTKRERDQPLEEEGERSLRLAPTQILC